MGSYTSDINHKLWADCLDTVGAFLTLKMKWEERRELQTINMPIKTIQPVGPTPFPLFNRPVQFHSADSHKELRAIYTIGCIITMELCLASINCR